MQPRVLSIIVCTYNRAKLLRDCLDSLVYQTINHDLIEIIIIDNNSTDNTKSIIKNYEEKYAFIKGYFEPLQGHASARNKGYRNSKCEYVAYIDDDCIADKQWCAKIVKTFQNLEQPPTAVGGKILPRYETNPPKWFYDELEIRSKGNTPHFLDGPSAKNGFSGANMAIKRSFLEQAGGFSTNYGIVNGKLIMGEDTELFHRLYLINPYFWYDPEIVVFHWVPKSSMKLFFRIKRSYISGKSWAYCCKKDFSHLQWIKSFMRFVYKLIILPFFCLYCFSTGNIRPIIREILLLSSMAGGLSFHKNLYNNYW